MDSGTAANFENTKVLSREPATVFRKKLGYESLIFSNFAVIRIQVSPREKRNRLVVAT